MTITILRQQSININKVLLNFNSKIRDVNILLTAIETHKKVSSTLALMLIQSCLGKSTLTNFARNSALVSMMKILQATILLRAYCSLYMSHLRYGVNLVGMERNLRRQHGKNSHQIKARAPCS